MDLTPRLLSWTSVLKCTLRQFVLQQVHESVHVDKSSASRNNNLDHGTKFRVYEEKFYIMAELDSYALSINSLASRIIHDLQSLRRRLPFIRLKNIFNQFIKEKWCPKSCARLATSTCNIEADQGIYMQTLDVS